MKIVCGDLSESDESPFLLILACKSHMAASKRTGTSKRRMFMHNCAPAIVEASRRRNSGKEDER
jgi:hypothetical protein